MTYPIPIEALDKHIAFLGGTGSGKTSGAKSGVVEPSLEAGERVLVIDPTSAWWGLRLGRDGKSKGYPVYIFGGDHGDYPLRSRDAEVLAETFATSSDSAIFDTSLMTVAERTEFFTGFAEAIRRKNRGPLKLVIDEAHLFMPQSGAKSGGAVPAMLHAGNNLVSLGRSRGLRITLISQRPAKLHKDSLTQVQSLVAMRLLAPQDRSAVNDWIADQADPTKGKDLIASLPTLKPGDGIVWAPLVGFLDRVAFPLPRTFDSSRAPEYGDGAGPTLAPVNLDALKSRLATIEAEAKANDPRALKAEIEKLKGEIGKLSASVPVAKNNTGEIEAAKAEGFFAGWYEGDRAGWERGIGDANREWKATISRIDVTMPGYVAQAAPNKTPSNYSKPIPAAVAHPVERRASNAKVASSTSAGRSIPAPLARILDAIAWWNVLGISAPTHAQVGFMAGYSHKSGTWATYLSRLRSDGLIEGRGDIVLTESGRRTARPPDDVPTGEELRRRVLARLDGPLQRILTPLLDAYPKDMSHERAGAAAGYSHSSGTWATYLSRLRSLDLIDGRGALRAQDWLFP